MRLISAVISGVLLALCLPRPGLSPLGWFAIAPLLFFLRRAADGKDAIRIGWFYGMGLFGTAVFWIYSTCRFAQVPAPIAVLAWICLAGVLSLQWAAFGFGVGRAFDRISIGVWPWACASLWAAIEFAFSKLNPGLLKLGYTQWRFLPLIQGSAWFGPEGLGFLIMLVNAAIAVLFESPLFYVRRYTASLILIGACVSGWWAYGSWSLGRRIQDQPVKYVSILQPNIDQYRKWDSNYAVEIRNDISELLKSAPAGERKPELYVWPESSVPGWLDEPDNFKWIAQIARGTGAYHIVGVLTRIQSRDRNSAALISPNGAIEGYYHKRRLVPFGEFVPLRPLFASWIGILDQMGDFAPGAAHQPPMNTPIGAVGATICYEAMFPPLVRASTQGARFMANLTNDGWYKDTWGPYQHFYANLFRAVENRVTVIRAANTGISGVIDPYGVVIAKMDLGQRGVLTAGVPVDGAFPGGSFYGRCGDWFGWLNLFAVTGVIIASWARTRGI